MHNITSLMLLKNFTNTLCIHLCIYTSICVYVFQIRKSAAFYFLPTMIAIVFFLKN